MSITTLDGFIGAARQRIPLIRTATRTTVAAGWFTLIDLAGEPGAGTLAGSSTAAGVVPDDTTAGFPAIVDFAGGAAGYLGSVEFGCTVACRIALFDLLFKAGAYAYNANTALSSQPSFSGRLPGTNYNGLELWAEQVTAATGNQAVNVTYTNQSGTTGQTTGAAGLTTAPTVGRCWQLPFASGDSGIQQVTNVAGSVASAGTFNVLVMRRLWSGRIPIANSADLHDMLRVGLPQVYSNTALYALVSADSTSSGISDLGINIVSA